MGGVRAGTSREHTRPFRAVSAAVLALALALPLFATTEGILGRQAAAAEGPACLADTSAAPATESARESATRQAAARWFPAEQVAMATAIAGAESSWNPTAVNKAAGGNYGLWQINSVHAGLLKDRNWRKPETNAWMAFQVWDAADGTTGDHSGSWTPWSVYNSGSYRAYLRADAASDSAASNPTACVTSGPAVRVGTWNVLSSNSKTKIAAGTRSLTTRTDVFGLQELGSADKRAAAARGATGFTMTLDRTAVPIFYRTDKYTALAQGRQLAFDRGHRVERRGGKGTEVLSAKWLTWVRLQDNATLDTFYVLNTHLLVGANNNPKERKRNPKRVALYDRQLATLTTLADNFRASGAAVYVTCDCNVDYSPNAVPVVALLDHGLLPNWQTLDGRATHGKRYLDYVWSNQTPASQSTGETYGSDHASVAVTYLPWTMVPVNGSPQQTIYSMRTITDPHSGQTFLVPIPLGRAGAAISKALDQVGDRWRFGGHGPDVWDCSGLTARAWHAAGVTMTAQSEAQNRSLRHVALADARPGDIFWREGYVSIYLGSVGTERLVVGSRRSAGAVVIHTVEESEIKSVLRPT